LYGGIAFGKCGRDGVGGGDMPNADISREKKNAN
jgi:hypothetical protein